MQQSTHLRTVPAGFVSKQLQKARNFFSKLISRRNANSLSDKDSAIARAWYSPSTLSDVHYYYNEVSGKTPSYNPFLRLS